MNIHVYVYVLTNKMDGDGGGSSKHISNSVLYILLLEYFLKNKAFDHLSATWHLARFDYYENDYSEKWF